MGNAFPGGITYFELHSYKIYITLFQKIQYLENVSSFNMLSRHKLTGAQVNRDLAILFIKEVSLYVSKL